MASLVFLGDLSSDSRIHSTSMACEACRSLAKSVSPPSLAASSRRWGVEFAPYAVGEGLGFFRCDPEAGEGLARQLQAGLQLRLHRLVDAQAAEVFELPGALGPYQEIGLGARPRSRSTASLAARASGMVSTTRRALLIPAASSTGMATASPYTVGKPAAFAWSARFGLASTMTNGFLACLVAWRRRTQPDRTRRRRRGPEAPAGRLKVCRALWETCAGTYRRGPARAAQQRGEGHRNGRGGR